MQLLSKLSLLLLFAINLTYSTFEETIFFPEQVIKTAQDISNDSLLWPRSIRESVEKFAESTQKIAKDGFTVNASTETITALGQINTNIGTFNTNLENSVFNEAKLAAFRKSCAYTFIGMCFAVFGIKFLHDAFKEIQSKINDKENKNAPWHKILTWRDTISPLIGLAGLGIGYKIISNS